MLLPAHSDIPTVAGQMFGLAILFTMVHEALVRSPALLRLIIGDTALTKLRDKGTKDVHMQVSNIISGTLSTTVACMYAYGCVAVHGNLEAMVNSRSNPETYAFTHTALILHCAYTCYEMGLYIFIPPNEGLLMYLHHAIVLGNFVICLLNGTCHYYACILGLTEGTNMCLAPVTFYKSIDQKSGMGFMAAAGGTWFGFLVLRILLVPWWIYIVCVKLGAIRTSYGDAAFYQLCLGLASAFLILGLSAFWFYKLTRIAIKMLFPKKVKKKKS